MLDATQLFDGTISGAGVPTGVAITSTRVSTNVLDLLTGRDLGADEPIGLHVDVTTAFTTTNSATLQIDFEVCATAGGSYLATLYSAVIPAAQLIIGAPIFRYALPVNQVLNATAGILNVPGRFIRLNYVVGTGIFSAGAVFSYINPRPDRNAYYSYPKNYTAAVAAGEI